MTKEKLTEESYNMKKYEIEDDAVRIVQEIEDLKTEILQKEFVLNGVLKVINKLSS